LYGTTIDADKNVDIFSIKVDRNGILKEGTLKVHALSEYSSVTSVLP
jgi:hypothetical protein